MNGSETDTIPDSIRDEAARWLAHRENDGSDTADTAFRSWLGRDLRHRLAYAEVERAWRDSLLVSGSPVARNRKLVRAPFHMRRSTHIVVASMAVLLAVGMVSVQFVQGVPVLGIGGDVKARSYRTQAGETRSWNLEDGSLLTLVGASLAHARFDSRIRRIDVEAGRARIVVSVTDQRPLEVHVAELTVQTRDAVLDAGVADAGGAIRIVTGRAETSLPGGETRQLVPGQGISSSGKPLSLPTTASRSSDVPLEPANGLTVDQAITLLNRSNVLQVRLAAPDLGARRLTGAFRRDDPEAFAHTVAVLNDLEVISTDDGILLRMRS